MTIKRWRRGEKWAGQRAGMKFCSRLAACCLGALQLGAADSLTHFISLDGPIRIIITCFIHCEAIFTKCCSVTYQISRWGKKATPSKCHIFSTIVVWRTNKQTRWIKKMEMAKMVKMSEWVITNQNKKKSVNKKWTKVCQVWLLIIFWKKWSRKHLIYIQINQKTI